MIVNPQLFSYRLIIGALLVVLTVIGIYSFNSYKSISSYEDFLEQEKLLIEKELSEMLISYDQLSEDYDLMASQLQEAKIETKLALDSLRLLKSDLSIISRFKDQLLVLKAKSKVLVGTIDSLHRANKRLEEEKRFAINTIEEKTLTINELEGANDSLNRTIDHAALLKAGRIEANSYKLKSGKKRFTMRARRSNAIDVCVTLNENPLTQRGPKDLYIQIVSPEGNVISDKGEIVFGERSLIYSKKETVDYSNESLEVCTAVVADKDDQPFSKGYYYINVFHENMKLGSTSILLK
jgi:hypothetical protein